jgi:hypothetical protein
LRLGDLSLWVLAAGVAVGLVRSARDVWSAFPRSLDRPAGVAAVAVAVMLIFALIRQIVAFARGTGPCSAMSRLTLVWCVGWRAAAIAALGDLVALEGSVLRLDADFRTVPYWRRNELRLELDVAVGWILLSLIAVGVFLAANPGGAGMVRTQRRGRSRLVIVPLVGLVGLLLICFESTIPYLILIAIECVSNATERPPVPRPGLWARLIMAGWQSLAAGLLLLITALWVESDLRLRRDRPGEPEGVPVSWRYVAVRLLSALATACAGFYMLFVTLPLLHGNLAAGIWLLIRPREVVAIVIGFGALSAGLAARALAPAGAPLARGHPGLMRRVVGTVLGLVGLAIGALMMLRYAAMSAVDDTTGGPLAGVLAAAKELSVATADPWGLLRLELVLTGGCMCWLAYQTVLLLFERPGEGLGALDAVALSRGRFVRFLCCWAGLTVVCLTALPAFFVGGIVLFHIRVHAGDLLFSGALRW